MLRGEGDEIKFIDCGSERKHVPGFMKGGRSASSWETKECSGGC